MEKGRNHIELFWWEILSSLIARGAIFCQESRYQVWKLIFSFTKKYCKLRTNIAQWNDFLQHHSYMSTALFIPNFVLDGALNGVLQLSNMIIPLKVERWILDQLCSIDIASDWYAQACSVRRSGGPTAPSYLRKFLCSKGEICLSTGVELLISDLSSQMFSLRCNPEYAWKISKTLLIPQRNKSSL